MVTPPLLLPFPPLGVPPDDELLDDELFETLPPGVQLKLTETPEATPGMSIGAVPRIPAPERLHEPTTWSGPPALTGASMVPLQRISLPLSLATPHPFPF
jgi:hypothetical protein